MSQYDWKQEFLVRRDLVYKERDLLLKQKRLTPEAKETYCYGFSGSKLLADAQLKGWGGVKEGVNPVLSV